MEKKQFIELMEKLEEIRCGVIDIEDQTDQSEMERLRTEFFCLLDRKTGWGKNEVKATFEVAVENVMDWVEG